MDDTGTRAGARDDGEGAEAEEKKRANESPAKDKPAKDKMDAEKTRTKILRILGPFSRGLLYRQVNLI